MDSKDTKMIFMGTPEFAVPILNALIKSYNVIAVVTQPDKKAGRKQILTQSPIKKIALKNKIQVLQPEKIKGNIEFIQQIKNLKPDLIIVAAYGFILPNELLEMPKFGVLNVHASLLPKYRGASPIQATILNGDKKTGVTIMLVNEKMDEGDILNQNEMEIADNESFSTLHDKLSILGTHLLIDTLPKYLNSEIKPQKQDNSKTTYCQLITKEDGKINWHKSAEEIERQVRALNPWPGTFTLWNNKKIKILQALADGSTKLTMTASAGEVIKLDSGLAVQCGRDALQIKELQLEGKKPMTDKEFLNGYKEIIGSNLK